MIHQSVSLKYEPTPIRTYGVTDGAYGAKGIQTCAGTAGSTCSG